MKDIIRQFKGKEHGHLVQFIKYAISGGIATVVHVSLFFFLTWKVLPALTANDPIANLLDIPPSAIPDTIRARNAVIDNLIAFMFSNFVVYLININWVFESGRHRRLVELGLFYAVAGVSVFIGSTVMGFLIASFNISTTVAFGANVVVCLLINYAMRKYVIFKG